MNLLERYLQHVKLWLPAAQQDDIIAELSDDIRSQVADREAELGRPLDDAEVAAILRERGHPMIAAGRYLPQQYLIGPALFPTYHFALKALLLWILVPFYVTVVVPLAALTADHPGRSIFRTVGKFTSTAFFMVGILTVVFLTLERHQVRLPFWDHWEPRRLVPLPSALERRPTSRGAAIFELVVCVLATAWWLDFLWSPSFLDRDGIRIALTPMWQSFYYPVLALSLAGIVLAGLDVSMPYRTRLRDGLHVVRDCATVLLACLIFKQGPWIEVLAPKLPASLAQQITSIANTSVVITLVAIVIVSAASNFFNLSRFLRHRRSFRTLVTAVVLGMMTGAGGASHDSGNPTLQSPVLEMVQPSAGPIEV